MIHHNFNFHRPRSITEAKQLFEQCESPVYFAGGQTILPAIKFNLQQPTDLISLDEIAAMRCIELEGDKLKIGALMTYAQMIQSEVVQQSFPTLVALTNDIADIHIRHRATIGGAIAFNDAASDMAAACLSTGASILTEDRVIPVDEYFLGMYLTALEPVEIITSIEFNIPDRCGYCKFSNPASGYPIVGVFVSVFSSGVRIGVTGAADCVYRESVFEQALTNDFTVSALAPLSAGNADYMSDVHASADYRAHLVKVMTMRAVKKILES